MWSYMPDPIKPEQMRPGQVAYANVYPEAQAPERKVGLFWPDRLAAKQAALSPPAYRLKIKARAWPRAGKWEAMGR